MSSNPYKIPNFNLPLTIINLMILLLSLISLCSATSLDTADTELDNDLDYLQDIEALEDFYEEMLENLNLFFEAFDTKQCDEACAYLGYDSNNLNNLICIEECHNYQTQMSQDIIDLDDEDQYEDELFDDEEFDEFQFDDFQYL